jgi:tetratricopeptide (TPR) repeat protein
VKATVLALAALLATAGAARAQSPLVAELQAFATRYHETPARLDRLYQGLTEAVRADSHLDNLLALAEICFIWGDVRAATREDKLEAYDRGRQAAQRAVELAPRNARAHLWLGSLAGRWGQTKGIMRSLFLLPTVREAMERALELDPKLVPAYSLAGQVLAEVPRLLGGDLERSETLLRRGLALDPHFTSLRVALARTLIKRGREDEARRQLRAVLGEKTPTNPATWTMKDSREAREILAALKGGS